MLYKIATAQICGCSRVCEHNPGAQVACVLCVSPDDSIFHRIYDCPCVPASFDLDRTERIVDEARKKTCPIFSFVFSHRVIGTLSCQSPMTRLLWTLARWISWVVTSSQMGAGELKPKTPASVAVALVLRGSFQTVVCSTRWEEELAYCMAGINQWQEPSSTQQLKLFGCAGKPRSKSSFEPIVCLSSTASPEGDVENTCPTLTCGKSSGRLTTPSVPQSCSTESE